MVEQLSQLPRYGRRTIPTSDMQANFASLRRSTDKFALFGKWPNSALDIARFYRPSCPKTRSFNPKPWYSEKRVPEVAVLYSSVYYAD